MPTKYDKNYTDKGYLMNYEKLKVHTNLKNQVLQFYIEIDNIEPTIWRRIQVPTDYNFWDLHVAIQDAFGWQDSHLHHFEIKGKGKQSVTHIGIPDFDRFEEMQKVYPGWEIWVLAYFNSLGVEAKYLYDYGDGWSHNVKLEGYIHREKGVSYPRCIDGALAGPPEDCGGVYGYTELVKTLADHNSKDYKELRAWVGKGWNASKFDRKKIQFDNPYKRWQNAFPTNKIQ